MKITIYTTTECQFSKQEKDYLTAKSLPFEEKNLETNREYLTEMLTLSNNFAGTPVTKIEKDDGQIVVLKGFTQSEFEQALGVSTKPTTTDPVAQPAPTPVSPTPTSTPGTPPPPVAEPSPTPPPMVPPVVQDSPPPAPPAPADPRMDSLLNSLQQKATDTQPPTPAAPAGNLPNIPDPNFG